MKSLIKKLQFSPCSKTPGGGGTGQCGPRKQNGIKWCGQNWGGGGGGGRSVQHHSGRHLRHCGWKLYLQPSHPEPPSCSASQTAAWLWTRDADDLQRSYTLFFSLFYCFFLITFFCKTLSKHIFPYSVFREKFSQWRNNSRNGLSCRFVCLHRQITVNFASNKSIAIYDETPACCCVHCGLIAAPPQCNYMSSIQPRA